MSIYDLSNEEVLEFVQTNSEVDWQTSPIVGKIVSYGASANAVGAGYYEFVALDAEGNRYEGGATLLR